MLVRHTREISNFPFLFYPSILCVFVDNFEPDSIDKTKGALLEDEQGQVTVQFAHLQGGEPYGFSGNQAACKEFDYFLFYCPDSQVWIHVYALVIFYYSAYN